MGLVRTLARRVMGDVQRDAAAVAAKLRRIGSRVVVAALALFGMALMARSARADGVTLPDTGVDISGFVTAAITALGLIVVTVVGGYFAFLLIRWGLQWSRKAKG